MDDRDLSIGALQEAYRSSGLSPVEVARAALGRADAYDDPAVWITRVPREAVIERAAALAARRDDIDRLALYGVPFAVKDNIDVAGLPTTAACPAFAYLPSETAPVVARLIDAGAILIGKTNLDQFATGLVGTRSPHGAPRSVFDRDYVSGGSSSGSAVAAAAGLVSFALGTDTAGSGRVPAAFNNLVGVKPSRGLLSARGVVPACRTLDCVTIFAGSVADGTLVRRVAEGLDAADPYSRAAAPVGLPEHPRFGVLRPADRDFKGDDQAAALYQGAVDAFAALGAMPIEIDYAAFQQVAALLYAGPWVAERLAAIRGFVRDQAAAMDPVVRGIVEGATRLSAADAFDGQYRLKELARATEATWRAVDLLLLPTTPTIYRVDEIAADPVRRNADLGLYTNFTNLLDLAALAVPAGFRATNGLPFGVTLIGPAFSDDALAWHGARLHAAIGSGAGRARRPVAPPEWAMPIDPRPIRLAVAGAHLSGMPLNHELLAQGAVLERTTRTASEYRLFALDTTPPKPGLARRPGFEGPGIEVEIWRLDAAGFGRFVAGIPAPMGIGKVMLADGSEVAGFLCEAHALDGAADITGFGGWRAFRAQA